MILCNSSTVETTKPAPFSKGRGTKDKSRVEREKAKRAIYNSSNKNIIDVCSKYQKIDHMFASILYGMMFRSVVVPQPYSMTRVSIPG